MRIGPELILVAVPGELFAEVGLKLRQAAIGKQLFIVGYSNGYVGYLPSAALRLA